MNQIQFLTKVLITAENSGWFPIGIECDGELIESGRMSVQEVVNVCLDVEMCEVVLSNNKEKAGLVVLWQGHPEHYPEGEEVICDYSWKLDEIMNSVYKETELV
jgi:hypothetical protein